MAQYCLIFISFVRVITWPKYVLKNVWLLHYLLWCVSTVVVAMRNSVTMIFAARFVPSKLVVSDLRSSSTSTLYCLLCLFLFMSVSFHGIEVAYNYLPRCTSNQPHIFGPQDLSYIPPLSRAPYSRQLESMTRWLLPCMQSPALFRWVYQTLLLTLKALPRQSLALDTAILQSLRSRMLMSISPFFFLSLLMVSIYLNVGLPLGLTPSTSMPSTVLVIWLSSLHLTCPYQRSHFCIRCVVISWTVAASLISSFLLWSLGLTPCIHRHILISIVFISISSFFIVQHSAPYVIAGFITVL